MRGYYGDEWPRGMAELNVYSKGHLPPWGERGRQNKYYDEVIAEGTDTYEAYVGLSNNSIDGSARAVLFEVPDNIRLVLGN